MAAEVVDRWASRETERWSPALPTPFYLNEVTRIFKNLLAGITSPSEAAKRIESAVLGSQPGRDFWPAYELVMACILSAAESFGDDLVLRRLAALVAALGCLPDAKNTSREPVCWGSGRGKGQAAPGETITCGGRRLWAGLPGLFEGLVGVWEGQEAAVWRIRGLSDGEARDRWANVNAFCAYLTQLSADGDNALSCDGLAVLDPQTRARGG